MITLVKWKIIRWDLIVYGHGFTDNDGHEEEMDNDVAAEKSKLHSMEISLLLNEYDLILK
jgi:hypothetical protein